MAVTINNSFAWTEVDQIFINRGDVDLEGIKSFPLSRQASLSELSLFIDGREVIGEVLEKARAREVYEAQKAKGNDTALAEKDDYKTFNVAVAPVRARAETRVRLVYCQPLTITPGASLAPIGEGIDWVFVLDVSGSMGGDKIRTLSDGVARVIGKMSGTDRFRHGYRTAGRHLRPHRSGERQDALSEYAR